MYQKIRNKFRERPTLFYACSIVASWAGVGSLMNFRTIALNYGAVPAIIWAVFNSLACILFGLFVDRVPSIRRIMQSKVMFYFIGLLTLFQTWTQMSGIYEIFGDTPIGTSGGMVIVYITCAVFLIMLLKDGMIRNVLSDGFSWVVVYGLLGVVVVAALIYTRGAFASIDMGTNVAGIKAGVYNGLLLLPGPFACPYYYSLYEYNDSNADGTRRSNIKMSFVWAGLMFGIYMVLAALLTWVQFSPVLNVMKAILITVIAISSLSTYLYCEYLVFGKKNRFCAGCLYGCIMADSYPAGRYGDLAAHEHHPYLCGAGCCRDFNRGESHLRQKGGCAMKITVKKLADLRKPAHNIRRHSDKQITEYIRSIEMFGQIKPLVVDEHGEIIAGNGLFEALTRMGRETCDCYVVSGLTDVQKKKLMMADNKVYELGFTDTDAIEQLVKELDGDTDVPGWDADLLKMLDSTIEEADEIVNDYGSFPDTEVANMNRRPVEEHIPYADTPSYPVTPPSDETQSAPAQPAAQPPAAVSADTGVSTYTPQDSPAQPPQSGDDGRRYIICPKCGERICL